MSSESLVIICNFVGCASTFFAAQWKEPHLFFTCFDWAFGAQFSLKCKKELDRQSHINITFEVVVGLGIGLSLNSTWSELKFKHKHNNILTLKLKINLPKLEHKDIYISTIKAHFPWQYVAHDLFPSKFSNALSAESFPKFKEV